MEGLLIELLIAVLVLGAIFLIVRLAARAFGLPPMVVQIVGIVCAVLLIIWLVRLLPAVLPS